MSDPTCEELKAKLESRENQLRLQQEMSQSYYHEARAYEKRIGELEKQVNDINGQNKRFEAIGSEYAAVTSILREFYDHSLDTCDAYGRCEACDGIQDIGKGVRTMLSEIYSLRETRSDHRAAKYLAELSLTREAAEKIQSELEAFKLFAELAEEKLMELVPVGFEETGHWPSDVAAYISDLEQRLAAYEAGNLIPRGIDQAKVNEAMLMLEGAVRSLRQSARALV